ncbi:MAG: helix-turn-helix domain-containing protein [bacterium]|nr:helix-turn-helix domain-containing protein [bacterium]
MKQNACQAGRQKKADAKASDAENTIRGDTRASVITCAVFLFRPRVKSRKRFMQRRKAATPRGEHNGELLTLQECAVRLSIHHVTVRRAIKSGFLPAFRVGGVIRISNDDIDAYLRRRRIGGAR